MKTIKQIKFQNKHKPKAHFDILRLEDLFKRKNLDHSLEDFHKVEFYLVLLTENGSGYHTIDFTDYQCNKGTILTIRKDQIHKFFRSNSIRGSLFLFTDEFLVSYLEKSENLRVIQLFNELLSSPKLQLNATDFEDIQQIKNRIEKEYFEKNDNYSMNIIRSELQILITKLFRIKSQTENLDIDRKYLREFIDFQTLIENIAHTTTKVKDYATHLGISTKTLNTITQEIAHKTAKEFINEIAIKQIKRLLINTQLSIKEIAYQSGFEESTNFYKYFKRHAQTTPERFRTSY
ncbi:MAG: helix-turn-helix transcriptional regulator [Saprospiraceae bacterium]